MILQALTEYYETLAALGEIAPQGYGTLRVSFALCLAEDGRIVSVVPLKRSEQVGKKNVVRPPRFIVPEPVVRSGNAASNFLCDNAAFFLGIGAADKLERTKKYFEAAKNLHLTVLEGVAGEAAASVRAFFEGWEIEKAAEHPLLAPHMEELNKGANLAFFSPSEGYAFDDPYIRAAWKRYKGEGEGEVLGQCLVTGKENEPISRLHPKIKGILDAQSSGASLVSFNASAYESYGKTQNFNAPVSAYAAFAYTTALNHLIAQGGHSLILNGDTVLFWAKDGENAYAEAFLASIDPRFKTEDDENIDPRVKTKSEILGALEKAVKGEPMAIENLEIAAPFCILCLSPNAARLSVRFFYKNSFGNILKNIGEHYARLDIEKGPRELPFVSLYWLLKATVAPQSKENAASRLLAGSVLLSVISGARYPEALYTNILMRVRAERKVDRVKAAAVKAYLIHNGSNKENEEVLQVALNEASTNKPYVLGRLFALLEQTQESANPGINATITDKYFDSACATPRIAFPTLLKLSRHHIKKDDRWGRYNDRLIAEVAEKLEADDDPYPAHLTLEEQGLFILGYYHQRQTRFRKKDKVENNEINREEN